MSGGEVVPDSCAAHTLYSPAQRWLFLAILFGVSASNYMDRNIIAVLLEPIKKEFGASDTLLGLLSGAAFAVLNAALGIPVARWADRGNRKVIITLALAAWSAMTMLCGLAQTFWQLALARVAVGVGEAGAIPPSQSLIVDQFPAHQRARALGIFTAGSAVGILLAYGVGAHIAATQGWRAAFIVVGAPGLILAALAFLFLQEPRVTLGTQQRAATRESFLGTLRVLSRKPTYRHLLIGSTVYAVFIYGTLAFVPAYLVRVLGISLGAAGAAYGSVIAVSSLVGSLGGGFLADRLAARDARWLLRLPAISLVLACPLFIGAFMVRDFTGFLVLFAAAATLVHLLFPPIFAGSHMVCGSPRRATSVAILLFFVSLIGGTLGPLAIGMMSDALTSRFGAAGLAHALTIMPALVLVSAWSYFRASRTLREDIEA